MKRILTILMLIVAAACTTTPPVVPPVEPAMPEPPVQEPVQSAPQPVVDSQTAETGDMVVEEEVTKAEEHKVEIRDFKFMQNTLTINAGDSVTWTNADGVPHTATGSDFDTGKLAKGQSKTVKFDKPGSYTYVCSFHTGMKGTIVVE